MCWTPSGGILPHFPGKIDGLSYWGQMLTTMRAVTGTSLLMTCDCVEVPVCACADAKRATTANKAIILEQAIPALQQVKILQVCECCAL